MDLKDPRLFRKKITFGQFGLLLPAQPGRTRSNPLWRWYGVGKGEYPYSTSNRDERSKSHADSSRLRQREHQHVLKTRNLSPVLYIRSIISV